MGRSSRLKPLRLGEKLKHIRECLGLSQDGMLVRLGVNENIGLERSVISAFELGKREPTFDVLLAYARIANIYVDVLIDDKIELPPIVPSYIKYGGD